MTPPCPSADGHGSGVMIHSGRCGSRCSGSVIAGNRGGGIGCGEGLAVDRVRAFARAFIPAADADFLRGHVFPSGMGAKAVGSPV